MVSYSEIVECPIDIVWEHFIYKIDNPQFFVPGVSDVIIKEKNADFVVREMNITSTENTTHTLVEKITHSPYQVNFLILKHPIFKGYVDNFAEKISDTKTKITFSIHWVNKETNEEFINFELVKNAVLKTVNYINQNN